jgi:hypothetical protein
MDDDEGLPYETVETYDECGSAVNGYMIDANFEALAARIERLERALAPGREMGDVP